MPKGLGTHAPTLCAGVMPLSYIACSCCHPVTTPTWAACPACHRACPPCLHPASQKLLLGTLWFPRPVHVVCRTSDFQTRALPWGGFYPTQFNTLQDGKIIKLIFICKLGNNLEWNLNKWHNNFTQKLIWIYTAGHWWGTFSIFGRNMGFLVRLTYFFLHMLNYFKAWKWYSIQVAPEVGTGNCI